MKCNFRIFGFLIPVFIGIMLIIGCEGPEGAQGPAGKDGANGTAVCGTCHNSGTKLSSRKAQWELSKHGKGEAFMDANRTTCGGCHTSEGYLETAATGADTVVSAFASPSTINCRTCHNIHKNYDSTDWKFTYTSPFTFRFKGHKDNADLGDANLCARCHQARILSPDIDETKDSVRITSFRWGPHYGGQSNMLLGQSAYSLDGTPLPTSNTHKPPFNARACITCHMSGPLGLVVGGHTFNTAFYNEETGSKSINTNGCLSSTCHSKIDSKWNPDGKTTIDDIVANINIIREKLVAKGWIDTTGSEGNPKHDYAARTWNGKSVSSTNPMILSRQEAKILANYLIVVKDFSNGVHNPKYVSAVLEQTKKALE